MTGPRKHLLTRLLLVTGAASLPACGARGLPTEEEYPSVLDQLDDNDGTPEGGKGGAAGQSGPGGSSNGGTSHGGTSGKGGSGGAVAGGSGQGQGVEACYTVPVDAGQKCLFADSPQLKNKMVSASPTCWNVDQVLSGPKASNAGQLLKCCYQVIGDKIPCGVGRPLQIEEAIRSAQLSPGGGWA